MSSPARFLFIVLSAMELDSGQKAIWCLHSSIQIDFGQLVQDSWELFDVTQFSCHMLQCDHDNLQVTEVTWEEDYSSTSLNS